MQLYLNLFVAKWNKRDCTMEEIWVSIFGYITGKTCRVKDIKECAAKLQKKKELIRLEQQKKEEDIKHMQQYLNENQGLVASAEVHGQTLYPQNQHSAKS